MAGPPLAGLLGFLLVAGAAGARTFTRWIARDNDRKVVLIAAVTAWSVLFGMVPFGVFAGLVRSGIVTPGSLTPVTTLVLNLLPFTLLVAPVVGYVQGMAVSRGK